MRFFLRHLAGFEHGDLGLEAGESRLDGGTPIVFRRGVGASGSEDFLFQQATPNTGFLKGELDLREVLCQGGAGSGKTSIANPPARRFCDFW